MSKVQNLYDAIKAIDTNDYRRSLMALGTRPVSQVCYLRDYKPKRDVVEKQIRLSKKKTALVYGSLVSLDKKLEDAQSNVNLAIKQLDTQIISSDIMKTTRENLGSAQKNIAIIRSNIFVFKEKLNKLDTL